jgi:hypothetical protein
MTNAPVEAFLADVLAHREGEIPLALLMALFSGSRKGPPNVTPARWRRAGRGRGLSPDQSSCSQRRQPRLFSSILVRLPQGVRSTRSTRKPLPRCGAPLRARSLAACFPLPNTRGSNSSCRNGINSECRLTHHSRGDQWRQFQTSLYIGSPMPA